jgi:hypothetical protein
LICVVVRNCRLEVTHDPFQSALLSTHIHGGLVLI